ncbi:MAG: zf-HC2 domain-containing protein [bacterium]|nr:MAG: zf-HC2 domain-containing protein [bacterium]
MNNPCEKIQDKIADYVLGILRQEEIDTLDKHINQCPRCREYTESLQSEKRSLLQFGKTLDSEMDARQAKVIEALNQVSIKKAKLLSIWRIIMKSQITKIAAAVAVILAVTFPISLLDKSVTTAYALEQSIEANHTIQTMHLRIFEDAESIENNEFMDCWMKYDDAGLLSNLRWNSYDDDGVMYSVWNEGVAKGWRPAEKVLTIIRNNNAATMMENFAKNFDPKLILKRLYELQENKTIELKIDEPAQDGFPIYVEAINPVDKTRLELVVDSETKLVTQLSRYSLGELEDELNMRIEFLAYNQPIDQSVFELSGIPDDAFVYDQVDQLVGLEKGDLTDNEIAVKVVRECLEATITQDYDEVSRLMEGDPGDTIEEFIKKEFGARLVRIISIGRPKPHEIYKHILYVPCEIEVENEEKGSWAVNIISQVQAIDYQPGFRWIMREDIEVNK